MSKKYYSQVGQDKWVEDFFGSDKRGYFLDIGAYDGIKLSNTYYLERELGWTGICVEADPVVFKILESNRRCVTLNTAISDREGMVDFSPSGLTGRIKEGGGTKINSTTLRKLLQDLECPKTIDYISLDIEGFESIALEKFPFESHEFVLMTVEHNLYLGSDSNKKRIKEILLDNQYSLYKENVEDDGYQFEDWYINKKFI